MNVAPLSDEILVIEANGKKYAALSLVMFSDIPIEKRIEIVESHFGLKDIHKTKSLYEIVDEKKLLLAKIKYGI
jgi:hypothetical protein